MPKHRWKGTLDRWELVIVKTCPFCGRPEDDWAGDWESPKFCPLCGKPWTDTFEIK